MEVKRYFLALMMVAFHALALTAGEVWTAKNVPIPFLRDSLLSGTVKVESRNPHP